MCGTTLIAERTPLDHEAILGEQAHIAGKEPTSARHGECDPDVVDHYENLILLCGDDHTRIDKQPLHYTRELILRIKQDHERRVERALERHASTGPGRFEASDLSAAVPANLVGHRLRGRDDLLAELACLVGTTGGSVVLRGTGGCGKSALARATTQQVRDHRTVWWVDGSTRATLVAGLFEVAVQAGANRAEAREVWSRGESAQDLLWHTLGSRLTPWLLVVDNADDPSLLEGWLREPPGGNTLLVTTRDHRPPRWSPNAVLHQLLPITSADGAAVLTDLAPEAGSASDAEVLADRLGGLPLALMLVGRYLARTSTGPALPESRHARTFAGYTAALDAEFAVTISALSRRVPSDEVLARTWEKSLDLLDSQGVTAARPVFRLLSFFASAPVPTAVLKPSVLRIAPSLFGELDSDDLEDAVDGLLSCGLLDHQHTAMPSPRTDTLSLHPLLAQISKIQPDVTTSIRIYRSLRLSLLCRTADEHDPRDHANRAIWQLLLPHCTFTPDDTAHTAGDGDLVQARLAYYAAEYTRTAGLWTAAEEFYDLSLGFLLKQLPDTHEDVLITRHNRALLKLDRGHYGEAESQFRRITDEAVVTLGEDHPRVLAHKHELARLLRARGDLEGARKEFASIVPMMTTVLGSEHEHTLAARHEQARTRFDLGDLDFAEREFTEVLEAVSRTAGPQSPIALTSRHELAGLALRRGHRERARALFEDLLAIETELQGPDHPSTLVTRAELAGLALEHGDAVAAAAELRAVVSAWHQIDENHHDALIARSLLVHVLMAEGDLAAALAERRAIAVARGAPPRSEADDLHELADTLFAAGHYPEAEAELRAAAAAQERMFGARHPDALVTQAKAATCLVLQGDVTRALTELTDLLPHLENVHGPGSEYALMARLNLAHVHQLLGNSAAAMFELRLVLRLSKHGSDKSTEIAALARAMLRTWKSETAGE
ncbi:hypothetical protein BBK82_26650 [Lentzea guizhouensis]|uniref:Orc1-like AAA ATPase domain-containing protein n=1 Tax=Lentzea guizhouensis TaxID=1586287 RepID=A0A1B2HN24_9PSEU|nr:tetratricopeptide repeat protein [Lentzea guizhouensis]ANZ39124.1 hypothetical protein BBK82_26650 [Lentzea guizhouensis]